MWNWLRGKSKTKASPLVGAPAVRRVKTYSAMSGYVYQYCFEGRRLQGGRQEPGLEYVFSVSADRSHYHPVSVFVLDRALTAWEFAHERSLSSTERYALAKLSLFQAFDERDHPRQMREPVTPGAEDVERILAQLDVE